MGDYNLTYYQSLNLKEAYNRGLEDGQKGMEKYQELLKLIIDEPLDLTWKIMSDKSLHACILKYQNTNHFYLRKAETARLIRMFLPVIEEL